jgi:hypothetical protein
VSNVTEIHSLNVINVLSWLINSSLLTKFRRVMVLESDHSPQRSDIQHRRCYVLCVTCFRIFFENTQKSLKYIRSSDISTISLGILSQLVITPSSPANINLAAIQLGQATTDWCPGFACLLGWFSGRLLIDLNSLLLHQSDQIVHNSLDWSRQSLNDSIGIKTAGPIRPSQVTWIAIGIRIKTADQLVPKRYR